MLLCFAQARAQNPPANMNLVPNGSFEYDNGTSISSDTSFTDNNYCWVSAIRYGILINGGLGNGPTTCNQGGGGARTGDLGFEMRKNICPYVLSLQKYLDTNSCYSRSDYAQTKLLTALKAGTTYYFTLYVGTNKSNVADICAQNRGIFKNIGVLFTHNQIYDPSISRSANKYPLGLMPQIRFLNWIPAQTSGYGYTKLTASYTAQGGERYMTIGTFAWDSEIVLEYVNSYYAPGDTVYLGSPANRMIDDVSLVEDTTLPMIDLSQFSLGKDTSLCPGDSIQLGGEPYFFHYWWNTGDTTRFITAKQPGTYWCTVDYGCSTFTDTIHILPPASLAQKLFRDTVLCFPATLSYQLLQRYNSQLWSTGDTGTSISVSAPGLYWVQRNNGCNSKRDSFTVTNKNVALPQLSLPDVVLCPPAGVLVTAPAGPFKYMWSTGDTTLSIAVTQAGSYNLQITNDCGTSARDTFSAQTTLSGINLGPDTLLCNTTSGLPLSLPAGLTNILWSTGQTGSSILVQAAGTYSVVAQNSCGFLRDTILILSPASLAQKPVADSSFCFPGTFAFKLPQRYKTQLWSTGDTGISINFSAPGLYWVQRNNGCSTKRDSFTVTNKNIALQLSLPDVVLCPPAGALVTAPAGPFKYLWSTGDTTVATSINQTGSYSLQLTNVCGAKVRDTFRAENALTGINLGPDTLLCNTPPELLLTLPAGLTNILWSTGQTGSSILVQAAGIYSVAAQTPCGILRDTIKIDPCPPEVEVLSLTPDTACAGECIQVEVTIKNTVTQWDWTFAGGQPDRYSGPTPPRICYAVPGIYPIRLIVGNGANSDTATAQVVVVEQPQPRFRDTALVARYGDFLKLPACANALHIDWYDAAGKLLCADCATLPLEAKEFQQQLTCVVRNTNNCEDSCRYSIRVTDIPTEVWVPGAFTPNGDDLNERIGVMTTNPNVRIDAFRIFDRWGALMWEGKGLVDEGWDGTYKGTPVTIGAYYWMLQYHVEGAAGDFFLKGDVMLLR